MFYIDQIIAAIESALFVTFMTSMQYRLLAVPANLGKSGAPRGSSGPGHNTFLFVHHKTSSSGLHTEDSWKPGNLRTPNSMSKPCEARHH